MRLSNIPTIETSRLRLRKLRTSDLEPYFQLASSEEVTRYMLWKPHKTIAESEQSIRKTLRRYEEGSCCRWAISLRETDVLIGIIDLLDGNTDDSCTFAYMLRQSFWGKGYGTEAVKAVFHFAFTKQKVRYITADHFAENPASGRVMEKAGMMQTRFLPAKYEKNGHTYDAIEYTITRSDWDKNSRAGS